MGWRQPIGACVTAARVAISAIDRSIMPRCCVFCGTECDATELFCCTGCALDLPWNDPFCPRCAEPLATALAAHVECAACQREEPPFTAAAAPLLYAFPVDAAEGFRLAIWLQASTNCRCACCHCSTQGSLSLIGVSLDRIDRE